MDDYYCLISGGRQLSKGKRTGNDCGSVHGVIRLIGEINEHFWWNTKWQRFPILRINWRIRYSFKKDIYGSWKKNYIRYFTTTAQFLQSLEKMRLKINRELSHIVSRMLCKNESSLAQPKVCDKWRRIADGLYTNYELPLDAARRVIVCFITDKDQPSAIHSIASSYPVIVILALYSLFLLRDEDRSSFSRRQIVSFDPLGLCIICNDEVSTWDQDVHVTHLLLYPWFYYSSRLDHHHVHVASLFVVATPWVIAVAYVRMSSLVQRDKHWRHERYIYWQLSVSFGVERLTQFRQRINLIFQIVIIFSGIDGGWSISAPENAQAI